MFNKTKRALSVVLVVLMVFMIMPLAAAVKETETPENNVTVHKVIPENYDWENDAAYIDFESTEQDAVPLSGVLDGNGLSLLTSESTGNTRASNIVDRGYLSLGKNARKNDNPEDMEAKPTVSGAVYIRLHETLANKANTPYIVKIDYYGGNLDADDGINGGSYIDLKYNSQTSASAGTRFTYGESWKEGAIQSAYIELPKANFNEANGNCKADFRLETWTGAIVRIRRISVITYEPINIPEMKEVSVLKDVANADFAELAGSDNSKMTDGVLEGPITGNGLSLLTSESTGNTRGSNILSGGYLLLGKEARQNDNPADMAAKPKVTGAVYLKLEKPVTEKQDTAYAVKIEYYGGGLGLDGGSYIDFCYTTKDGIQNKKERFKLGNTYNSGKTETGYWLIPEADFQEDNGSCKADFRFETWSGAQIKIKSVSVVSYDPAEITDVAQASALFNGNSDIAGIDFGNIDAPSFNPYTADILNGEVKFDGLSVVTNIANGNQRAANRILPEGYMLLGKEARLNTLTGSGTNQGRIYVKLNETIENKQNKAYAIKVDYLDSIEKATVPDAEWNISSTVNTINSLTWMSVVYTNKEGSRTKETARYVYGGSVGSGTVKSAYFLLPDANLSENVDDNGQNKGADFKINCQTNQQQLKIRSISVVEYDSDKTSADASQNVIAGLFAAEADEVFVNVSAGERYGMKYPDGTSAYKIVDNNGEHFGLQAINEALSFTITDPNVKAAEKVTMKLSYWDIGTRSFSIQYNASRPDNWEELNPDSFYNYYSTPAFEMFDTGNLITIEIPIENADFQGKQNGGADFRIRANYISDFYIEEISVKIGVEDVTVRPPVEFPEMTDTNNFKDKTVVGYQAWFKASDDLESGWDHWNSGSAPAGGKQKFDIYPDINGYSEDVLYKTGYANFLDGRSALLYDGTSEEAIDTQVRWMQEYGIDGFAVSRFYSGTSQVKTPGRTKLDYMVEAAEKYDRLFYMGYDISGIGGNGLAGIRRLQFDFVLNVEEKFVSSPNYAQIDGKPVVSLWGFQGSEFNRYPNAENALILINWFKERGYYVIGGVPDNNWAKDTSDYKAVYEALDMITPWTVGRFNHTNAQPYLKAKYEQDRAWLDDFNAKNPDNQKSYMPTLFPGFSWATWASGPPNATSRLAGEFIWDQATLAKKYGFTSSFIAMFDEYDEGTSILKMAEDSMSIPSDQYFVTAAADGKFLSSDFYMRATAAITKMLRGELPITDDIPIAHSNGPVFWRNGFERRYINYKANNNQMTTALANVDVCVPDGEVLINSGIEDLYMIDMYEDPYQEGYTTTGDFSFKLNGLAAPNGGKGQFYFRIAETDIEVRDNMVLSYNLRADTDLGGFVFVDLMFDNGKKLSEISGSKVKAKRGTDGEWTPVTLAIDSSLKGRTIQSVIVGYESEYAGEFNAYIDDIVIEYTDATNEGLKALVARAESIISDEKAAGYTSETVKNLRTVISKVKDLLKSGASDSAVKAAYYDLIGAMNSLVGIVKTNSPIINPAVPDNSSGTNNDKNNNLNDGTNNSGQSNEQVETPQESIETPNDSDENQTPPDKTADNSKGNTEQGSSIPWLLIGIIAGVTAILLGVMIIYSIKKNKKT